MSLQFSLGKFLQTFKCCVCRNNPTSWSVMLDCLHIACGSCLSMLRRNPEKPMVCKLCRRESPTGTMFLTQKYVERILHLINFVITWNAYDVICAQCGNSVQHQSDDFYVCMDCEGGKSYCSPDCSVNHRMQYEHRRVRAYNKLEHEWSVAWFSFVAYVQKKEADEYAAAPSTSSSILDAICAARRPRHALQWNDDSEVEDPTVAISERERLIAKHLKASSAKTRELARRRKARFLLMNVKNKDADSGVDDDSYSVGGETGPESLSAEVEAGLLAAGISLRAVQQPPRVEVQISLLIAWLQDQSEAAENLTVGIMNTVDLISEQLEKVRRAKARLRMNVKRHIARSRARESWENLTLMKVNCKETIWREKRKIAFLYLLRWHLDILRKFLQQDNGNIQKLKEWIEFVDKLRSKFDVLTFFYKECNMYALSWLQQSKHLWWEAKLSFLVYANIPMIRIAANPMIVEEEAMATFLDTESVFNKSIVSEASSGSISYDTTDKSGKTAILNLIIETREGNHSRSFLKYDFSEIKEFVLVPSLQTPQKEIDLRTTARVQISGRWHAQSQQSGLYLLEVGQGDVLQLKSPCIQLSNAEYGLGLWWDNGTSRLYAAEVNAHMAVIQCYEFRVGGSHLARFFTCYKLRNFPPFCPSDTIAVVSGMLVVCRNPLACTKKDHQHSSAHRMFLHCYNLKHSCREVGGWESSISPPGSHNLGKFLKPKILAVSKRGESSKRILILEEGKHAKHQMEMLSFGHNLAPEWARIQIHIPEFKDVEIISLRIDSENWCHVYGKRKCPNDQWKTVYFTCKFDSSRPVLGGNLDVSRLLVI